MDQRERRAARREAQRRSRCRQGMWIAAILLAIILIFDLSSLLAKDRSYSESENRMLAGFPKLSSAEFISGKWFSGLESYQADQFVGRDFWITLKLRIDRFFGQRESGGVYLGKDHYLIQAPSEPNEAAFERNMAAINAFAARHPELQCDMTVAPNAVCILADKLPRNAPAPDQREELAELSGKLQGVRFLDVTDALAEHADEPIYYRTDHHWTSLGASYAFQAMAPKLGLGTLCEYEALPVSVSFQGTLSSRSGSHSAEDKVEIYVPKTDVQYKVTYSDSPDATASMYVRSALEQKDHYTVFFGGNHPRVDIATTAESDRNLLIFKDSYANCFVQFLTPYYSKIILVDPRYYYDSVDTLIKQEGINRVLYLYNLDTFQTDTALADVLEAES